MEVEAHQKAVEPTAFHSRNDPDAQAASIQIARSAPACEDAGLKRARRKSLALGWRNGVDSPPMANLIAKIRSWLGIGKKR